MVLWITDVPGISNFRDLATANFPQGLVYRSADLSELESAGLEKLSKYISTVIDVRSMPEIRRNGTIGPPTAEHAEATLAKFGVTRIHAPIFLESDYSPLAIAQRHNMYKSGADGFLEAYQGILKALGPTLRIVFRELAKTIHTNEHQHDHARGILIHCSAGKDRTGILCAILLLLSGVSPEAVANEYALTTQGLAAHHDRILRNLGPLASAQDKETATVMMSSEAVVMRRTIDIIKDKYGGVEKLVQRHVDSSDYMVVCDKLRGRGGGSSSSNSSSSGSTMASTSSPPLSKI